MKHLIPYYQNLMGTLGVSFGEDGFAVVHRSDTVEPLSIDGKRLVMPIPSILANPNWESQIAFHPFSEAITRGESEIINWLRERITRKLTLMIGFLLTEIATIATSADKQKKLSPEQLTIISELGASDERTGQDIAKVIANLAKSGGGLVKIYLKRDGHTKHGLTFRRLAVVTFPILEDLDSPSGTSVHGVTMRMADKKFMKTLFEMILPDSSEKEQYSCGSNADTGPYFEALVNAYNAVSKPLSGRIWVFRDLLDDVVKNQAVPPETFLGFDDAVKESIMIPPLPGNIGKGGDDVGAPKLNTLAPVVPTVMTAGAAPNIAALMSGGGVQMPAAPFGMMPNYGNMPPIPGVNPMMGGMPVNPGMGGFNPMAGFPTVNVATLPPVVLTPTMPVMGQFGQPQGFGQPMGFGQPVQPFGQPMMMNPGFNPAGARGLGF